MKKYISLLLLFGISFTVTAQSIEEKLTQRRVSCYDIIANAGDVLQPLYDSRSFDSIQAALQIARLYCDSSSLPLFYLQTLLSIEQSRFSADDIAGNKNFNDWLQLYAVRSEMYNVPYSSGRYFYNVDNSQVKLYALVRLWALNLLATRHLSDNEAFVCNVLAGNIKNPQATVKDNKQKYPELYAALRKNYSDKRTHPDGNAALILGTWLPAGNAKLLGIHPQLGFQTGGRNKLNEIDLTMLIRFSKAANNYTIFRKDSLYSTTHFLGGYIGLDYTRYIIHTTNFEMGVTAGAGFDGFDVMNSDKYKDRENDLEPYTIGCLNLNAGMRFNYYFNPHLYIGIGGRFNKLNYKNKGGTNLQGNAVSIDFFIGG